MDHCSCRRPVSRNAIGEALIVISVVAGFFWMLSSGRMALQDFWFFAGFLGMIVIFYFALLFCRMLFFWMTGGELGIGWGEMHEEHLEIKKKAK